jgi:hypothetical protein
VKRGLTPLNPLTLNIRNIIQTLGLGAWQREYIGDIRERFHLTLLSIVGRVVRVAFMSSAHIMDNQAGPSRPKQPTTAPVGPKEDVDDPRPAAPQGGNAGAQAEEGDEDEERMDFKAIESIAR